MQVRTRLFVCGISRSVACAAGVHWQVATIVQYYRKFTCIAVTPQGKPPLMSNVLAMHPFHRPQVRPDHEGSAVPPGGDL